MNNTIGFKAFKLHSDSTLESLTKKQLISYIHMLHHNWQVTDESYQNVMEYARKLNEENGNLEKALDKMDDKLIEIFRKLDNGDCKGICDKGNRSCENQCITKGYWKGLFMTDE